MYPSRLRGEETLEKAKSIARCSPLYGLDVPIELLKSRSERVERLGLLRHLLHRSQPLALTHHILRSYVWHNLQDIGGLLREFPTKRLILYTI